MLREAFTFTSILRKLVDKTQPYSGREENVSTNVDRLYYSLSNRPSKKFLESNRTSPIARTGQSQLLWLLGATGSTR